MNENIQEQISGEDNDIENEAEENDSSEEDE